MGDEAKPVGRPGKFEVIDGIPVISDAGPDDRPMTEEEFKNMACTVFASKFLVADGQVWIAPEATTISVDASECQIELRGRGNEGSSS